MREFVFSGNGAIGSVVQMSWVLESMRGVGLGDANRGAEPPAAARAVYKTTESEEFSALERGAVPM